MNFPSEFFRTPFFGEAKQLKNRPTNDWLPPPSSQKKQGIYVRIYIYIVGTQRTPPPKQIVIWYDTVPSWHSNLELCISWDLGLLSITLNLSIKKLHPSLGETFCVVVVFHRWKVDLEFQNLRSSAKCLDFFADHIDYLQEITWIYQVRFYMAKYTN